MFSKTVFVCLLAVYVIQPNEAILGLDTFLEGAVANIVTQAISAAQSGFTQASSLLTNLQSILQTASTALNPQISAAVYSAIISAVTQAGGNAIKVANCITQSQSSLTALETSALNTIVNTCLKVNVTEITSRIGSVTSLANNLTNIAVNANTMLAAACPPSASGNILGLTTNAACTVTAIGTISGNVASQLLTLTGYVNQATALINSIIQTTAAEAQSCVQIQIQAIAVAPLVIAPIVQCTLAP